jgi:secreted trypsin-like serine protease
MKARALTTIAILSSAILAACDSSSPTRPQVAPADQPSRIIFGTVDGNAHPAVGLLVLDVNGTPTYRCSGTFLSPTVFLTAGHCVGEPGEFSGMRVFTESDVEHGNNNYPFAGPNTIEATSWQAHPLFTEAGFPLHDVGVVVLSAPFNLPANQYGVLPAVNQLDALHNGANTLFTSVGYGSQKTNPAQDISLRIRESAQVHLIAINTPAVGHILMILSNNGAGGGSCFGDSGGPNYIGTSNVIAATTSFGRSPTCGGTGGVFRLDQQDVIDFVNWFLQ